MMFSSEEPERIRGVQHGAAWIDELCSFRHVQETFDQLQFGLRLGKKLRQVITCTPKPIRILKELFRRANEGTDVVVMRGSTYDNKANLAPSFLDTIIRRFEGTRIGRQELMAEVLSDNPGALWTLDMIEAARIQSTFVDMARVVVAIDPAVTAGEDSDLTSMVVCGLGVHQAPLLFRFPLPRQTLRLDDLARRHWLGFANDVS